MKTLTLYRSAFRNLDEWENICNECNIINSDIDEINIRIDTDELTSF